MKSLSLFAILAALSPTLAQASPKCPAYVQTPVRAVCNTQMSIGGAKMNQKLNVPLKATGNYKEFAGQLDFAYPGISIGGGKENTLKILVEDSTHGNSETCPSTQTIQSDLSVLGTKVIGGRKTVLSVDKDVLGAEEIQLQMSCTLE